MVKKEWKKSRKRVEKEWKKSNYNNNNGTNIQYNLLARTKW